MNFTLQAKRHKACEEANDALGVMWAPAEAAQKARSAALAFFAVY